MFVIRTGSQVATHSHGDRAVGNLSQREGHNQTIGYTDDDISNRIPVLESDVRCVGLSTFFS
jgi:hypothetical protein